MSKRIRVLGGGFYGCHIALMLKQAGHEVELHESRGNIFLGASGSIPARIHQGFHYPRSRMTRAACHEHSEAFMALYGQFTHSIPVNIYAIAKHHSLVDFDQYVGSLKNEVSFVPIHDPAEYGLENVEGALLTGERHIVTNDVADFFRKELDGIIKTNMLPGEVDSGKWDFTIDCTFCANDSAGVDRYEPCLVPLLEGPTFRAITIMDGPFPSLYPWNEKEGLCSLSSAKWTPFRKDCKTWESANFILSGLSKNEIDAQTDNMIASMAEFYPAVRHYKVVGHMLSIRAMPLSGADTRLVDVIRIGERTIRVRAGKIDAIIHAGRSIMEMIA